MSQSAPLMLAVAAGTTDDQADDGPSLKAAVIAGTVTVIACFGGFLGWSLFARLDAAVIAAGAAVAESQRKTVQHLEGGILRELLVREGEAVRAGQAVAILDTTQADAQLAQVLNQRQSVRARLARLYAEQAGQRQPDFPADLREEAARNPHAAELLDVETRLFGARRSAHDGAIQVLNQRIVQSRAEIAAAESQLAADRERLALYEEELAGVVFLLNQGYERRPRLLELKRTVAELKGRIGELGNTVARARAAIAGTELEIANTLQNRLAEIARDLSDSQAADADLNERIRSARDVRQRKQVVSPQDGVVVDVRTVTPGGVIGPGQPLMDIIPVGDELTIETRISPSDIERVYPGLTAEMKLSAYKRSVAPMVEGTVVYVSADKLVDPRNGEPYFLVRVRPDPAALAAVKDYPISPGMPLEVMINTGRRRAIDYFLEPLTSRLRRSMHED